MCEDLLSQSSPFCFIESLVERKQSTTAFQTIASHLQFVHCMNILYMHLDTRTIRCLRCPHVKILMPTCFEIESIIAVVEIGKFGKKAKVIFGVQF